MKIPAAFFLFILTGAIAVWAQSPAENKLELGGELQGEVSLLGSSAESPLYQLQYFGRQPADVLSKYDLELYLNGDYQGNDTGVHVRTLSQLDANTGMAFTLLELFGEYYPSEMSYFFLGKKAFIWGKGYAFNTVNYAGQSKDPENPELVLEGVPAMGFELSQSFSSGILNTASLGLYVFPALGATVPTTDDILNTALAGKVYLLLWDTDIDIMLHWGRNKPLQFGADLSRNITSNLELHGELSYALEQWKYTIESAALHSEKMNGLSYLAGLRWLSPWNMTTIFEYYHNGAGLTKDEFLAYSGYLSTAAASGAGDLLSQAKSTNMTYFNKTNPMTDYLYLKMTQPEPFNLVDFSISAYSIFNISDYSAAAGLRFDYQPVTNLELSLQSAFFIGTKNSEFGSRPYHYTVVFESIFSF
jgi:hypothetical protein